VHTNSHPLDGLERVPCCLSLAGEPTEAASLAQVIVDFDFEPLTGRSLLDEDCLQEKSPQIDSLLRVRA